MTEFGGWRFPAGERHLPGWMKKVNDRRDDARNKDSRLLYQGSKYRRALQYVSGREGAVDIGGHVGLWSWQMALDFARVWAFEPMPEHRLCYEHNMRHLRNWTLFPFALGEKPGTVHVRTRTPGSSGDTGVDLSGNGLQVKCVTLDEFDLAPVNFIKVDCEGFEVFVLRGAVNTIMRNKPTIIVEQKPETGMEKNYGIGAKDAVAYLKSLGMRQVAEMAGDHVMIF